MPTPDVPTHRVKRGISSCLSSLRNSERKGSSGQAREEALGSTPLQWWAAAEREGGQVSKVSKGGLANAPQRPGSMACRAAGMPGSAALSSSPLSPTSWLSGATRQVAT